MNITMCISRIAACCFGALVPGLACAAVSFAPPRLPTCAFADTEASSNFVFGTGTDLDRNWILAIEADVSSNNNVQVEFGVDRDGSGALSVDERELAVGWDCGEWALRDRRGDAESGARETTRQSDEKEQKSQPAGKIHGPFFLPDGIFFLLLAEKRLGQRAEKKHLSVAIAQFDRLRPLQKQKIPLDLLPRVV